MGRLATACFLLVELFAWIGPAAAATLTPCGAKQDCPAGHYCTKQVGEECGKAA